MVNGHKYKKFVLQQQEEDLPGQIVGILQRVVSLLFVMTVLVAMVTASQSTS